MSSKETTSDENRYQSVYGCKLSDEFIKARSLLRDVEVLRYDEKGHYVIDISLFRTIPDDELKRHRNVGEKTLEKIREIRRSLDWVL